MAEGWTTGQDTPRGGEAQAVQELQRAWADLRRRLERVERAGREGERHREQAKESGGWEDRPTLQPFRQPAIPPEMEREMQDGACGSIRGAAARLAERDREVVARERGVRKDEGLMPRGAQWVISDLQEDTPLTDVEERSLSRQRARGEGGEAGQERGKRRRVEEQGSVEAAGAPRPTSPSSEPTPMDSGVGVPTTAAVSAAAGAEGAGDSPRLEGGGCGGAGLLCEVGREEESGAGETRDPPFLRPGQQSGEATGNGAGDGREQVEEVAGRGAPGAEPGMSPGTGETGQGADAEGAVAEGGVVLSWTMARRREGQESVHMGDRMQSQAHGCRGGSRALATVCRRAWLKRSTQEGGGGGQPKGRHGEGDERGDTEGQEEAGTMPAEEEGQHGRRGRGDERRGHGRPEGGQGTGSAAAEARTVEYGNADRSKRSGRAARGRPVEPASVRHHKKGATVDKLESAPE